MTQPKEWVTIKEAADIVDRSPRAVYNWINSGDLAVIRDDRNRMLVLSKAVLRIVQEQRPGRPKGTPTRR